jgi:glyoxylate/hydroxypyruvate reductase A
MAKQATLLVIVPIDWGGRWLPHLEGTEFKVLLYKRDAYKPEDIDYVLSFRPPPGKLKEFPNLKAVFSLGAGVDGFLADPDYPRQVPLVRLVDSALANEMAQFSVMHVLIHFREQRRMDEAQKAREWRQFTLQRSTNQVHVGILGLGEIGQVVAQRIAEFGFTTTGWGRTRKNVPNVKSYAGEAEMDAFLNQAEILICVLPLTPETTGILNKKLFAKLPKGAFLINIGRGGHQVEEDIIPAIDSGQLSGAVLDVFRKEPLPAESPFWTHPKITVTPHLAAISDPRMAMGHVIDGLRQMERGERPENIIDFERGY